MFVKKILDEDDAVEVSTKPASKLVVELLLPLAIVDDDVVNDAHEDEDRFGQLLRLLLDKDNLLNIAIIDSLDFCGCSLGKSLAA